MHVSRIDHIHIKVDELEKTTQEYEKVFGFSFPPVIDFTDRSGFKVVFNQFPNGIELMKVVDNTKPMARLYDEAPVGVFALSLKVDNLEKSIAEMERFGYRHLFTYGGGEIKEGLFDTVEKLGVYIELVEYPNDDISSTEFVR